MKSIFSGKKGSLVDPIFGGAQILVIAMTIFIAVYVWYGFQDVMSITIAGQPIEAQLTGIMNNLRATYNSFDYVFPFFVGAFMILSLILAFKTGANIAWGFMSFIVWVIAVIISTVYVNSFAQLAIGLPTIYSQFTIISAIMENMNWIVFGWVALITLAMFRKSNQEDDATNAQRRFSLGV